MKNTNILDIRTKNYGECGYCSENIEELKIPWEMLSKWLFISLKMGDMEWGGIFTVEDDTIVDFKIPKQEVAEAEVEFKEDLKGNGIIHSHHSMGAFHSSQDDHHARNLYDYSIVLSTTNFIGTKKVGLPCGGVGYVRLNLILINAPEIAFENIKEKKDFAVHSDYVQQSLIDEPDLEDLPCAACVEQDCENCEIYKREFYKDIRQ